MRPRLHDPDAPGFPPMPARLEQALLAVITAFPLAHDSARAAGLLEAALGRLINGEAIPARAPVDALGAPLNPRSDWESLRLAARALVGEIGIDEAARRYGCQAETLADLIYRTRPPGLGRQARLLRLVVNRDAAGPAAAIR